MAFNILDILYDIQSLENAPCLRTISNTYLSFAMCLLVFVDNYISVKR